MDIAEVDIKIVTFYNWFQKGKKPSTNGAR